MIGVAVRWWRGPWSAAPLGATGRHMTEDIVIPWLLQLAPLWTAVVAGLAPAAIAGFKRRPIIRWYLYGFVCTLVVGTLVVGTLVGTLLAWPLVVLPTIHALLVRAVSPEQARLRQRRAQALALFAESSVRSYPSWIAELRRKSPAGVDRRRYAYDHMGPGEAIELVREATNQRDDHAVAYYHRGVHLGYIPKRHRWVAEAIDDGHRLVAIVDKLKVGGLLRRRARSVRTRIAVLDDDR
jgi:hypothetical protein